MPQKPQQPQYQEEEYYHQEPTVPREQEQMQRRPREVEENINFKDLFGDEEAHPFFESKPAKYDEKEHRLADYL